MDRTWTRVVVWVAVGAIVVVDAVYLAIVRLQGAPGEPTAPDVLTVPFVATYLAMTAALLAISLVARPSFKPVLRAASSAGLFILAGIAAFSIGVLTLPIAMLATASTIAALNASHDPKAVGATVAGAALAVAVLLIGFQVVWSYLVCPPTGTMGGTTAGFFGQVSYSCDNGRLTTH